MSRDTRRTRVLLALLLLTSVSLITIDYRATSAGERSPLAGLRSLAAAVFGPVEQAASAIAGPVSDAASSLGRLGHGQAQADKLARTNQQLREQVRVGEVDQRRVRELDRLLHVAGDGRYRVVPARVIAIGAAQAFSWTVTIDAGRHDGIRPDMTVLNGDGLVGRVKTVGPTIATVLLAVDPASSVGVRLAGSMEVGFTTGGGINDDLALRLLDAQSSVAAGDRLVTFGSQGGTPYVPGVPVGTVDSVTGSPGSQTRAAVITPYVDFTSLDLVGVVVEPPRRDPRDAVLPPKPAATATPTPTPTLAATPLPTVTVTVTAKPATRKSG